MDIRQRFGTRVRYLRSQRHWTQETVAERAGLTPKYLGRIERGEVYPSLRVLEQLAKAFDMPVHELVRLPEANSHSRETLHSQLSASDLKQVRTALAMLLRLLD
jgi:transcriptional regulator with XRE-family HTH domain